MDGPVRVAHAQYSTIGDRGYQEDRCVCVEDLNAHLPQDSACDKRIRRAFYAVYDGHGGDRCSQFLAQSFHVVLAAHPELERDPKRALHDTWDTLDARFYERCLKGWESTQAPHARTIASFPRDGSTATVLLLVGDTAYVTNCGDSSAVLLRRGSHGGGGGGGSIARRASAAADGGGGSTSVLTEEHGTLNRSEAARIVASGGTLRPQLRRMQLGFPLCCIHRDVAVGKPRVYPGGLLLTRAFGDYHSKVTELGGVPGTIVSTHGELREFNVGEGDVVVLASDGVWDPIPPLSLGKFLETLQGSNGNAAGVATSNGDGGVPGSGSDLEMKDSNPLARECCELVEAAVAHPFWLRYGAAADNASAIMLQFGEAAEASGDLV